jgi:chondroitin-sulfate-ABC endolyase/exolyase
MKNKLYAVSAAFFIIPGVITGAKTKIKALDFETGKAPVNAEITSERYLSGKKSLLWQWNKSGAKLTIKLVKPVKVLGNKKRGKSAFGVWIYNEKPLKKLLYVSFLSKNRVLGRAWYYLDFMGWRPLGAMYDELGIKKNSLITAVQFKAPTASGRLYLDYLSAGLQIKRGLLPDYQQPWAGDPRKLKNPSKYYYTAADWSLNRLWLPKLKTANAVEKRDLTRLDEYYVERPAIPRSAKYGNLDKLKKDFAKFQINRTNGIITGKPIQNSGFLKVPGALSFNKKYLPMMQKLVRAYRAEKSPDVRQEILQMYIDLNAHLLDQGWVEGNNNMGRLGNGYDIRYWPNTVFCMRNELTQSGLFDSMVEAVTWQMMGYEMVKQNPRSSTDQIYNYSAHLLRALMLTGDPKRRLQRMHGFKLYLDAIVTMPKLFGPDGSIHHHGGHHLGYGGYSPPIFIKTQVKPLHGTVFQISDRAREKLRNYVRAIAFQSSGGKALPNLYLRAGTPTGCSPATCAGLLAELEPGNVDIEMAGIYLSSPEVQGSETAKRYTAAGIERLQVAGQWTLNQSATGLHRRDDWLVAAVGMVNGFRGLEIYGWIETNNYGRYTRNGSVYPVKDGKCGWAEKGWNWNVWPGATTVVRPSYELYEGYKMFGSRSDVAGATDLNGNGVWGMDFKGLDVHFKKSAFMFDGRVTVITTNINKANPYPGNSPGESVITGLYQQAMDKPTEPTFMNDKKIEKFPFSEKGRPVTLVDIHGNGYYIWPVNPPITVKRERQSWLYMFKRYLKDKTNNPALHVQRKRFKETPISANEKYYNPSEGDFASAWFDHGKNPVNASCVYTMLPFAGAEKTAKFIATMKTSNAPVKILAKSSTAHVVYDRPTDTYGYVIFKEGALLPKNGPVQSVSRPCFLMVKGKDISVAISDPGNQAELRIKLRNEKDVLKYRPTNRIPIKTQKTQKRKRKMKKIAIVAAAIVYATNINAQGTPMEFKTVKVSAVKEGKVSVNELKLFNKDAVVKMKHRKTGKIISKGATYTKTYPIYAFDGNDKNYWRTRVTKGERSVGFKFKDSVTATRAKVVIRTHMKNFLKLELLDAKDKVIFSAPVPLSGDVIFAQVEANKK